MSKNQNNSGPQKNNTSKPAKHRVSDKKVGSFGGSFKKGGEELTRPSK